MCLLFVSHVCFFWCIKQSYVIVFSVVRDLRTPFVLKISNTFKARCVVLLCASVFMVLFICNNTQIAQSVVIFNAIDMVNLTWQFAMYIKPCPTMRFKAFLSNTDFYVTFAFYPTKI